MEALPARGPAAEDAGQTLVKRWSNILGALPTWLELAINAGQTLPTWLALVKRWSNAGQTLPTWLEAPSTYPNLRRHKVLVKYWSNTGQTQPDRVVGPRPTLRGRYNNRYNNRYTTAIHAQNPCRRPARHRPRGPTEDQA